MGTKGTVKWMRIKKLAKKKGIEVLMGKGGERKLMGEGPDGKIHQVRIGHKCCNHPGAEVYRPYLDKLQNHFGWSDDEIYWNK